MNILVRSDIYNDILYQYILENVQNHGVARISKMKSYQFRVCELYLILLN